jgi:enoyl-CoA hydratase/carnithine racemase
MKTESISDDSHYFCALVPELFSLVYTSSALTASEALAAGLGSVAVPAGGVSTTAAGLAAVTRPETRSQTVRATARSQANTDRLAPEVLEEDEEPGFALQDKPEGTGVDVERRGFDVWKHGSHILGK